MERYAKPGLARQERIKAIDGVAEPTSDPLALEPPEPMPPVPAASAPAPANPAAEWVAEFNRSGRDYR